MRIAFDNSYAALPPQLFVRQDPEPVPEPRLMAWNAPLAAELGLPETDEETRALAFSGNAPPEGAAPLAQLYAGHQFGFFNPQLGDGRALLLGEVVDTAGQRRDIQLKGSGRTPWSRGGDGRAWLGPVLREYVVSEAMHALGIPTTRALAAVRTGAPVWRESALPGAVLSRVAASHIRVGTFQALAARGDAEGLRALFDHARARHAPGAETPLDFLRTVIARQAYLVAEWMRVGFIHGVMNTDNSAVSGETIDYGPCAFLDEYDPGKVFSSIDQGGRYAFSAQPDVIVWNMAQLASALVPLCPDQDRAIADFTEAVHAMPEMIRREWLRAHAAKIGISEAREDDRELIAGLLRLMAESGADYTNTFRALGRDSVRGAFADTAAFDAWAARWRDRIAGEPDPDATMRRANPAFIPRNHRVEQMIAAAVAGDEAPLARLMEVLSRPYEDQPDAADLQSPPKPDEVVHQTFCGT